MRSVQIGADPSSAYTRMQANECFLTRGDTLSTWGFNSHETAHDPAELLRCVLGNERRQKLSED